MEIYLCGQGDGPQQATLTISEAGETTQIVWDIDMEVWIPSRSLSEMLLDFVISPFGLAATLVVFVSLLGMVILGIRRVSHNRRLEDAYKAYDIKQAEFALSPEFQSYELPSAPDLSAMMGQQAAPVQLPSIPSSPEDSDTIPEAPDLD